MLLLLHSSSLSICFYKSIQFTTQLCNSSWLGRSLTVVPPPTSSLPPLPLLDTPSPSSRRSFPPSFWDSNYSSPQSRSHCETGAPSYSMDPYASGLHPSLQHPHTHPHPHAHPHSHPHPPESWGYPQAQAYGPPRPLHELYSPSALEPHYGPLLMPTVRPPHLPTLPSHYEVSKLEPATSWPSLLPPGDVSQTLALNMDAGNHSTMWGFWMVQCSFCARLNFHPFKFSNTTHQAILTLKYQRFMNNIQSNNHLHKHPHSVAHCYTSFQPL